MDLEAWSGPGCQQRALQGALLDGATRRLVIIEALAPRGARLSASPTIVQSGSIQNTAGFM